jgi:hypothetical protein
MQRALVVKCDDKDSSFVELNRLLSEGWKTVSATPEMVAATGSMMSLPRGNILVILEGE